MKKTCLLLYVTMLTSCASNDMKTVKEAAIIPLNDLNLVNAEIPDVLELARKNPYLIPEGYSCETLDSEITELDAALGADLDTTETESNPSLVERGVDAVRDRTIKTLRSTTQSVVPYRKWVRKLSGAERYTRKVAAAINAGVVRRAFLKGLRAGGQCEGDNQI